MPPTGRAACSRVRASSCITDVHAGAAVLPALLDAPPWTTLWILTPATLPGRRLSGVRSLPSSKGGGARLHHPSLTLAGRAVSGSQYSTCAVAVTVAATAAVVAVDVAAVRSAVRSLVSMAAPGVLYGAVSGRKGRSRTDSNREGTEIERERDRESVCVCVCVCERERACVCV